MFFISIFLIIQLATQILETFKDKQTCYNTLIIKKSISSYVIKLVLF